METTNARLMSRNDVAEYIGVSVRTIVRWVRDDGFPKPRRVNGKRLARWRLADVEEWFDRQPVG